MKEAHEKGAYDELWERKRAEAEARRQALRDEGEASAAKADALEKNAEASEKLRKRKRTAADALELKVAQLMERGATFLRRLGRGGSTELDVLDREAFREDEEALQDLVDAKDKGEDVDAAVIKKKRKALSMRETRARQALATKALLRRLELLRIRVAELGDELVAVLEEELRARAAA